MIKNNIILSVLTCAVLAGCSNLDIDEQKNKDVGMHTSNIAIKDIETLLNVNAITTSKTTANSTIVSYVDISNGFFSYFGQPRGLKSENVQAFLKKQGITVKDGYGDINISFDNDITFELQKTDIKESFKPILKGIAIVLNEINDNATFEVVGHTDYSGSEQLNSRLSKERATVITEELILLGVDPKNFTDFRGVSSSRPKENCFKLSCLRRIELIIHKKDILYKI